MPANNKIRSAYVTLPSAERKVADFILDNPDRAMRIHIMRWIKMRSAPRRRILPAKSACSYAANRSCWQRTWCTALT